MFVSSVERVVEYLDLPQEPPFVIEENRPPAYWPSNVDNDSLIVVEDLVVVSECQLGCVIALTLVDRNTHRNFPPFSMVSRSVSRLASELDYYAVQVNVVFLFSASMSFGYFLPSTHLRYLLR
jgi:hypothetical protein